MFPILWTLVCPLIDETSRAKFLFYATDGQRGDQLTAQSAGLRWKLVLFLLIDFIFETLSFNRDYLHEDKIPDWLGGLAQIPIPEGGLVPKNFYMSSQVSVMRLYWSCLFFYFSLTSLPCPRSLKRTRAQAPT